MPDEVSVDRTGPSIYAALAEASPDELPEFVAELRSAIAGADEDLDTGGIERVITRWWGIAVMRLNPVPKEERAVADRLVHGAFGPGWVAEQVRTDRQLRSPSKIAVSKEQGLGLTVFVADVERLALTLGVVLTTEILVTTVEAQGRCRNYAHVSIDNLRLTITDTGSVTHAELTVQVPDLAAAYKRLQAAEPGTVMRILDGRRTLALSFDSFSLFIIGE